MLKTLDIHQWLSVAEETDIQEAISALESGNLIVLPQLNFQLIPSEERFLTTRFSTEKSKNISYNCKTQTLRGINQITDDDKIDLTAMLKRFCENTTSLIHTLFPSYKPSLEIGRTSFRPIEISGRKPPSFRKDDTRLHVDAFPASPNQGRRILRVFSNINPEGKPRIWRVGESFEAVAKRFIPEIKKQSPVKAKLYHKLGITKSLRADYDHYMLELHNRMKADELYQKNVQQIRVELPSQTTWIVQTDQVSHAAMSGQYMLEQTFYLPVTTMQNPHLSPLHVLERLMSCSLT